MKKLSILTLATVALLPLLALAEQNTTIYETHIRNKFGSTKTLGIIPSGTLINVSDKTKVKCGGIVTTWYKTTWNGITGFVSDQNLKNQTKPYLNMPAIRGCKEIR